jgi:hypothetical protein
MDTIDTRTLLERDRDRGFARSDERILTRMAAGAASDDRPIVRNAMLDRDRAAMKRAHAAIGRFARTPAGRRCAARG